MSKKLFGKTLMKGFTGLFLSASILTLGLSGQPAVSAATSPDISKQVELKWYVLGNGQQDDTELVEKEVNNYLKDKINATLKLTTLTWGDDFEQKMAVKIAAGEQFDITFTASWALNYKQNASIGAFKDITDMMDTYAPKTKALLGENMLKGAQVNGRVYAIPSLMESIPLEYGILLNKNIVKKFKIDTTKIKKIEDLEASFQKIKAKQPKIINFYPFNEYGDSSVLNTLKYDNIVDYSTPGSLKQDGKSTSVVNIFETSEAKSLFNLMNKWYKKGYIDKYAVADPTYFNTNKDNIFAFCSSLFPAKCANLLESKELDLVPVSINRPTLTTERTTMSMEAISSTSKNPERALMFLDLINTDEKLSNMINYGIEGIHYKKTGERTISLIPENYEKYNPATSWMFGNECIAYALEGSTAKSETVAKKLLDSAVASPLLGFSFNSEPVLEQKTELGNIVQQYYNNLCLGKVNPSVYLPKMNKELKNAGLQKVLSEMQKQADAFISKNK